MDTVLRRGADVTAKDENGDTPLHLACFKNHVETTELLLNEGASIKKRNTDGITPLQKVVDGNAMDVMRMILKDVGLVDWHTGGKVDISRRWQWRP